MLNSHAGFVPGSLGVAVFLFEPTFFGGVLSPAVKEARFPASLNAYLKASASSIVVVGQTDEAVSSTIHSGGDSIAVRLPIASLRPLFGIPADELSGCVVPLSDLVGGEREGRLLESLNGVGREAKIRELTDFISGIEPDPTILSLVRLAASGKIRTLSELVDRSGYSERHLRRLFNQETGFPPKVFLSLVRFGRAIQALVSTRDVRLSELASACGYFDQAHLNRDFVRFASRPPYRFRASVADPYNTKDPFSVTLNAD